MLKKSYDELKKASDYYGVILIVAGLVFTFWGVYFISAMFAILICLSIATVFFLFFMLVIFPTSFNETKMIAVAVFGIGLGLVGAYLSSRMGHTEKGIRFSVALLGSWCFISLGALIIALTGLARVEGGSYYTWAIYIISGLIGFGVSFYFSKGIQLYLTAFLGSYSFVRGISLYAGGFINEFEMMDMDTKDIENLKCYKQWQFWLYIVGMLALFGLGVFWQRR